MRILISLAALATLASVASAQLSDLQPGRNFTTAALAFGSGRSENIDVGDVDNDGDYDAIVGNGGDGAAQANRIYVNNGNLQGGVQGTWTDGTAARFAGVPVDTTRDIEFVDMDGDNDLDIYVANRGSNTVGEVSRNYVNLGGKQLGTIGFYTENTDNFWGTLVSVPAGDEVVPVDNFGAWRDWSCDCEFGDLDNDGDLDLFHSSYGPAINGTTDHRIFLNTGAGRFNEMSPWANGTADIKTHAIDIDLADFDGDFDLDVWNASRDSQGRVFRNNLGPSGWTGAPFTDITQAALIATGATLVGTSNYEAEFADVDGDGDFDVWSKNYDGFTDRLLRNNGNFTFTIVPSWIGFDANVDENEVDFVDYDGDGDLDAFLANFSGTNSIYQSGLVDGGAPNLYTRCGQGTAAAETPAANNGGTTLDGESADLDGDGDPDLILANDANQGNRVWMNDLGVPDTHAPTFYQFTQQGDKSDGSDTRIIAQVRDNACGGEGTLEYYDTFLKYMVDGGPDTNVIQMHGQEGQQFIAFIPGGINGSIEYWIECTDDAGNLGVSSHVTYNQTSSGAPLWENLGEGTVGFAGQRPYLELRGAQTAGALTEFLVENARRSSTGLLWLSFASVPVNAIGGTIYATPFTSQTLFPTDTGGTFYASVNWPGAIPAGLDHYWQIFVSDAASIHGLTTSNAVHGVTP